MTAAPTTADAKRRPPPPGEPEGVRRIVRLWNDATRIQQMGRFKGLQIQRCDAEGQDAYDLALLQYRQLPSGIRIDLPSPRAFSAVLGVYRTAATLRNDPMLRLELSAEDIGELAGYAKATVEAVLRWLGVEAIKQGKAIVARGLGWIHRGRRTAKAYLNGQLRRVYRTSRTVLTEIGRCCLRLLPKKKAAPPARTQVNKSVEMPAAPQPSSSDDRSGAFATFQSEMRALKLIE